MLECTTCNKILQYSKFNRNTTNARGYQYTCKDCLKIKASKDKAKVTKEDAEKFIKKLMLKKEDFKCKTCNKYKRPDKFYYKRDRGKVYLNTTACKSCTRDNQRLRSFGINKKTYNKMLEEQQNSCAVCGIDHEEYKRNSHNSKVFAVDHDHLTGNIRGLLCCRCNRGLGYFKDNVQNLTRAISYLKDDDMV